MTESELLEYCRPLLYSVEFLLKMGDRKKSEMQKLRDEYDQMDEELEKYKQRVKELEEES